MKCLPASDPALLASGHILHDWHAEVVALRAFNHLLLQEARMLASCSGHESSILRHRAQSEISRALGEQPFMIREDLRIVMYCSEAPCGDASMELVMAAQKDATPWPIPAANEDGTPSSLLGRGSFSQLGIVRRKPSRGDSPPTLSKSCSDKLALKQCTSLLSSVTSTIISLANAYLDTLILPLSQFRSKACERSFGAKGRMKPLASQIWSGGYAFLPFKVGTTQLEFDYSRRSVCSSLTGEIRGCNITAVWNLHVQETLINGVLQGRKQMDLRGASALSRVRMLELCGEIQSILYIQNLGNTTMTSDYRSLRDSSVLEDRRQVKRNAKETALRGWT